MKIWNHIILCIFKEFFRFIGNISANASLLWIINWVMQLEAAIVCFMVCWKHWSAGLMEATETHSSLWGRNRCWRLFQKHGYWKEDTIEHGHETWLLTLVSEISLRDHMFNGINRKYVWITNMWDINKYIIYVSFWTSKRQKTAPKKT